jgi:hypothetical protein
VALTSLEELRGQDEPFWTALAAFTVGSVETALGRYDDALGHLREVRDLAERLDNAWLAAWSRMQLGTLAVMRGRLDEARALLDEGLDLSLGTRNTRTVTMGLAAFGRLAFVEGDAERAALLVGRPRVCAGGSGCGRGPCCGAAGPSLAPKSARRWGPTGSTRCLPLAPGSPSSRPWPPSATGAPPAPGSPEA